MLIYNNQYLIIIIHPPQTNESIHALGPRQRVGALHEQAVTQGQRRRRERGRPQAWPRQHGAKASLVKAPPTSPCHKEHSRSKAASDIRQQWMFLVGTKFLPSILKASPLQRRREAAFFTLEKAAVFVTNKLERTFCTHTVPAGHFQKMLQLARRSNKKWSWSHQPRRSVALGYRNRSIPTSTQPS